MFNLISFSFASVELFLTDGGSKNKCWRVKEQIKLDKGYTIDIKNLIEDHPCDATISLNLHVMNQIPRDHKNIIISTPCLANERKIDK